VRRGRKIALLLVALAGLLAVTGVVQAVAKPIFVRLGNIVIVADGGFKPKVLPKNRYAPISLSAWGRMSTVDGSLPPAVSQLQVDYDRNGLLTTRGLPVCNPSRLQSTTTAAARKACGKALIATGHASGWVAFPDQEPFQAGSTVLGFNGPRVRGNPTVILHAYAYVPAPTTFVIPVTITQLKKGPYRYRTTVEAPSIAGGYGVVTKVRVKVERRYRFKGKRLSYVSARCKTGWLRARGKVAFVDGTSAQGDIFKPCFVRKEKGKKRKRRR